MFFLGVHGLNRFESAVDIAPQASLSSTGGGLYHGTLGALVDGDDTTICTLAISSSNAFLFDFGAPVSMWQLRLGLNGGTHIQYVRAVYSDDGVTWSTTNQSAITKNIETVMTDYPLDDVGDHRFWGVMNNVDWYLQFTTVGWFPRLYS